MAVEKISSTSAVVAPCRLPCRGLGSGLFADRLRGAAVVFPTLRRDSAFSPQRYFRIGRLVLHAFRRALHSVFDSWRARGAIYTAPLLAILHLCTGRPGSFHSRSRII